MKKHSRAIKRYLANTISKWSISQKILLFYLDIFDYKQAEFFLYKLIVIYEKYSAKSEDLSSAYSRLADVKREQGKIDEALSFYQKSEQVAKDNLGAEHLMTKKANEVLQKFTE